jgi:hypothetical protein
MIYNDTNYVARFSYLCNAIHYVKCDSLVDASPCSSVKPSVLSVKTRSCERKYRANVREVDNSDALYLQSYFYGISEIYGSRMHAVSIFMQIQKLCQIVGVFIVCVQILDDIFVSIAHAQKNG